MDRQQLDSGDAKPDQIVDDRRRGERREGAALALADRRMTDREAAHMHLEDDRLFPRIARWAVVVPGEGAVDLPGISACSGRCRGDRSRDPRAGRRSDSRTAHRSNATGRKSPAH